MVLIEDEAEITEAVEVVMLDLLTRFDASEEALEADAANLPPISPETEVALLAAIEADLDKHFPKLT